MLQSLEGSSLLCVGPFLFFRSQLSLPSIPPCQWKLLLLKTWSHLQSLCSFPPHLSPLGCSGPKARMESALLTEHSRQRGTGQMWPALNQQHWCQPLPPGSCLLGPSLLSQAAFCSQQGHSACSILLFAGSSTTSTPLPIRPYPVCLQTCPGLAIDVEVAADQAPLLPSHTLLALTYFITPRC